jgi:hypothetical protein
MSEQHGLFPQSTNVDVISLDHTHVELSNEGLGAGCEITLAAFPFEVKQMNVSRQNLL